MAASFSSVTIVGTMTRDVELRHTAGSTAVAEISLAVNDRYKKGNEWVEEVSYLDCVLWGRTAEIAAEYCGKGSNVLISGKLKQDRWEKEGQKFSKVRITCNEFKMLGSKKDSGGNSGGGQSNDQGPPEEENIPF